MISSIPDDRRAPIATNIPNISKIEYSFVAPWLTRYDNAKDEAKEEIAYEQRST